MNILKLLKPLSREEYFSNLSPAQRKFMDTPASELKKIWLSGGDTRDFKHLTPDKRINRAKHESQESFSKYVTIIATYEPTFPDNFYVQNFSGEPSEIKDDFIATYNLSYIKPLMAFHNGTEIPV